MCVLPQTFLPHPTPAHRCCFAPNLHSSNVQSSWAALLSLRSSIYSDLCFKLSSHPAWLSVFLVATLLLLSLFAVTLLVNMLVPSYFSNVEVRAKAALKVCFWGAVGAAASLQKPLVMVLFQQPFLDLLLNLTNFDNCPSRLLTETSNIYIVIQSVGKRRPGNSFQSSIIMKVCVFHAELPEAFLFYSFNGLHTL